MFELCSTIHENQGSSSFQKVALGQIVTTVVPCLKERVSGSFALEK